MGYLMSKQLLEKNIREITFFRLTGMREIGPFPIILVQK